MNGLNGIYTPQLLRNGRDWRMDQSLVAPPQPAKARIHLQRVGDGDAFEARVEPVDAQAPWSAYWTVTEDGHSSRVKAGENAGAFLQHDFVVRQFVPVGRYQGAQTLQLCSRLASANSSANRATPLAAQPEHTRRVNLVVSDAQGLLTLQALSLACP